MNFSRYILILSLFFGQTLYAQTEKQHKFMQRLGEIFSETDSSYIEPNKYNLAFMIEQSFWHERYQLGARIDNQRQNITFAPTPTPKIGAYFGWW